MEVVLGALLATAIIVVSGVFLRAPAKTAINSSLKFSQARAHMLIATVDQYADINHEPDVKNQSRNYIKNSYVRVVIAEDSAYWIKDNALFTAQVVDGMVDKETQRRVDTMSMDSVELEKTMVIVEKLREGLDEDSGTGK